MLFVPNPLLWAADWALRRLRTEPKQAAACVVAGAVIFGALTFAAVEGRPLQVVTMAIFGAAWGLAASFTLVFTAAYKQRLAEQRGGRLGFEGSLRVGALYSVLCLLAAISLSIVLM